MCAIAGYFSERTYGKDVIEAQLDALYHRGPDSGGTYKSPDGRYTGGIRRLSINDIEGGNQPLYNEDKTVVLVYNGEIYNYHELRADLERRGHTFATRSDGETICHLYEEYGKDLFERLDGMFAAALWDTKTSTLILARDIPGEKPLYYSELAGGGIAFASEIKSLRKFPGINLELNYQAIWDLPTFLWVPEPDTIYKGMKALQPGHILIATNDKITIESYKSIFTSDFDPRTMSETDWIQEIRKTVETAIQSRLLSDVPIGSFLSAGLDSSIVTAIARKNLSDLSTFSVGFADALGTQVNQFGRIADESEYAEAYAKQLGTKHTTIRVTDKDFLEDLDRFSTFGDQPWGVSSGLGVLAVSRVAREQGLKVLLTGDGADECFGGYPWYTTLASDEPRDASQARSAHYYATEEDKQGLFNKERFTDVQDSSRWFTAYKDKGWSPKDFVTHDRLFYQPNEMLKKADRMTMAYSIEGRVPFVAPSVLTLVSTLPFELMVRDGVVKWALREAFSDVLPSDIINRPKQGFNIPIDQWLQTKWSHLIDETFSSDSELYRQGIITPDSGTRARQMLGEANHASGHIILCYIMLNKWLEQNKL